MALSDIPLSPALMSDRNIAKRVSFDKIAQHSDIEDIIIFDQSV
jgi:hypothetical protein